MSVKHGQQERMRAVGARRRADGAPGAVRQAARRLTEAGADTMTMQELVDAVRADRRQWTRSTLVRVVHQEAVNADGALQRLRPGVFTLRLDAAGPTRWASARAWVLDALVTRHEHGLDPVCPSVLVAELERAGLVYSRRSVNYALAALVADPSSGVSSPRFGQYEYLRP